MSQQRQFEGPDVRVLLEEIRATYGADPTISRAETFRTGGMLGFFQREHYRLVVEGEPVAVTGGPALTAGPVTAGEETSAGAELARAAYAAIAGGAPASATSAQAVSSARAASRAQHPAGTTLTLPGTDEVESLLARAGLDPFALLAEETEDTFVSTPLAAALPAAASPAPAPAAPAAPEAAAVEARTGEDSSFEEVLRRVASLVDQPAAAPMVWPTATAAESATVTGTLRFRDEEPTQATPAPTAAPVFEPAMEPAIDPAATTDDDVTAFVAHIEPSEVPPASPVTEEQAARRLALHRAGFDSEQAVRIDAAAAGQGLEATLMDLFGSLPEAPTLPRRKGSLIVVAGMGRRAVSEAARIATEVGADPTTVAYAGRRKPPVPVLEDLVVTSADDATEMAPGHRRGRVGVVAVDVPLGTPGSAWAQHVIAALRPTLVVGVVNAMFKNEDIEAWIDELGGVDTLIVDNVESTTSPARILELDVPVSRLGQHPANPARWTATVLDRVGAESDAAEG